MIHTSALCMLLFAGAAPAKPPVCKDARLVIEQIAAQPEIVTPVGMTIDAIGRIYVIESHTHFRPKNYQGPPADRIRRIEVDGSGKRTIDTFFEGSKFTMGVGAHPNGWLYVATRNEVFRIRAASSQGKATERESLVRMQTTADYPHNGMSGFAFDGVGNVYFGLGENFGAPYTMTGVDGSKCTGGGEGGSVFRCSADGKNLIRWSTGYWNPFHSCFDREGRLFVVDNDPDDRPPCRLLHAVYGSDFGYRFRNGRRGTHPFTAWNGELAGTLPMTAGTGEAPSGVVFYDGVGLPTEYRNTLLATSWGDHRLDRFRLQKRGASFYSQPEPFVVGGEDFRPVGIAAAPDGSIYISDWVDKSYELHRKGRVWRIRTKEPLVGAQATPTARQAPNELRISTSLTEAQTQQLIQNNPPLDDETRSEFLRRVRDPKAVLTLLPLLDSADPFISQAALVGLERSASLDEIGRLAAHPHPAVRVGAVLLMRGIAKELAPALLPALLKDADPRVRFAAIQTTAELKLKQFRQSLVDSLQRGDAPGRLLEATLAALDDFDRKRKDAGDERRGEDHLLKLLADSKTSAALIRQAVPLLRPDHPKLTPSILDALFSRADDSGRLEIVRTLRLRGGSQKKLVEVAGSSGSGSLRAEAVSGLDPNAAESRSLLVKLASGQDADLRREALRSLRDASHPKEELSAFEAASKGDGQSWDQIHMFSRKRLETPPPTATAQWVDLLAGPADPAAGARIFFHPKGPGCYKCHQMNGRGAVFGPDLTTFAGSTTRERLIESILQPSKEIAPLYVPWTIQHKDGRTLTGLLIGGTNEDTQVYVDAKGERFVVKPADLEDRVPSPVSIMPADLANSMTIQEFRDLLAFLTRK